MNSPAPPKKFAKHIHANQPQSYEEMLALDSREAPDVLRDTGEGDVGPTQAPTRWYLDRKIYEAEIERIWKRRWQMACRLDELAEVGDTFVYEVADLSIVIVRTSPTELKGFWNACLHRGVTLRKCAGRVDRLQCPFHGFTWGLDGKCRLIPNAEEFPDIDPNNFPLPEVKVAVWEDFVFINPDLGAESLEDYLGSLPFQVSRWGGYKGRRKVMHFGKVFRTNWKAVQEAFMESWHTLTTHPQTVWWSADRCAQFGTWGNFSRAITTSGATHDYMPRTPDEQEIWDHINGVWEDAERPSELVLPENMTARDAMVARHRDAFRPIVGDLVDKLSDTENIDIFYWTLFPNFNPFQGFHCSCVYRFRPYGNDENKCIMDVMLLAPVKAGEKTPPPAKLILVGEDEDFTAVEEVKAFGAFLSQDTANMNEITTGLRNNVLGVVNFARRQELKIRHFYHLYEQALGVSAHAEIEARKQEQKTA